MRRTWLIGAACGSVLLLAGVVAYAPYLPRLLREGYPSATWPAPGHFTTVAGASDSYSRKPPDPPPRLDDGLARMLTAAENRALLVSRGGDLVIEDYAAGYDRETRLNSYSMVKSLVGALVLKAVAEGKIASLATPIGGLLPHLSPSAPADGGIAAMPLCRFLDMRSGIAFQADTAKDMTGFGTKDFELTKFNLLGPMARLHASGLAAVASKLRTDASDKAGDAASCTAGTFSYQNVDTAILGAILEHAYDRPLEAILSDKIWKPAGAADAMWRRYSADLPVTPYCCLYARPIDWLRVGEYLLANGRPDAPFLPEAAWRMFLGLDVAAADLARGHYTNQTYHNVLDRPGETLSGRFAYFMGSRGQLTYLLPKERIVAIRFGGKIPLLHSTLYGIGRTLAARQ